VDTHIYGGYTIPPYYDSLMAKLLVHGRDREEAIVRGRRALEMFKVDGVKTSIAMHQKILDDPDFQSGDLSTHFMDKYVEDK
jgi:acetyl-CoA carboxylase biotin carboxylase subunit